MSARSAATPGRLAAAYLAALLLLACWPFELALPRAPSNGARLGSWGVVFPAPGVLRSEAPPAGLQRALLAGRGLAVELWLERLSPEQTGPARIVSYSCDTARRNFTLAQQGDALVVRLRTTRTGPNGMPELSLPGVFAKGGLRQLVASYDFAGLHAYLDGRPLGAAPEPTGGFGTWDPACLLLVGNEATGDRPWRGRIAGLAIHARPLPEAEVAARYAAGVEGLATGAPAALFRAGPSPDDFLRDAGTALPPVRLARPASLAPPALYAAGPRRASDLATNTALFLPLGLLLARALHGRAAGRAGALALVALLALLLEGLQALVPARTSSAIDLASRSLGGALGVLLVRPRARDGQRAAR